MKSVTSRAQRCLAAVLAPDAVVFSAFTDRDEESTHDLIKARGQVVISPAIHLNSPRVAGVLE